MQESLISVVMPCHDAAPFVEQAVRSALDQRNVEVDVIVVDDGSTDGSTEILRALADFHAGRMHVLRTERIGPYPARNLALRQARGEFVAFLDADDYWAPDCLATLQRSLLAAGADVAYCGWQNVGVGGPGTQPYVPPCYEAEDAVEAFLSSCPWPIHAALVRRSVLDAVGGFSERMFSSMDYDMWLRMLAHTQRIVLVPQVLAYYRWHDKGQISSSKWRQVLHAWQVRRDFVEQNRHLVAHLAPERVRELVDGFVRVAAYQAYWKRDLETSQHLFRKMARMGTWGIKDIKYVAASLLPARAYRSLVRAADGRP